MITIREFLTQFHGNEVTIALVLFCWLLLTGVGSLLATRIGHGSLTKYSTFLLVIALWPLPQMILIRTLRETFFIHGVSTGFYQIFFYITATTAPYCLLVGFILPYALKVLVGHDIAFSSGDLYITDSIGDIAGGVLFSFALVYWTSPFQAIALTSALLLVSALGLLMMPLKPFIFGAGLLLTGLFYAFSLNAPFEVSTLSDQYGHISRYIESPYGRIVITREGSQHTFWESGLPLYSDADLIRSEEKVHYPMSQRDKIKNVLLVSGGLGETVTEIQKHRPEQIHYVELDPYLTKTATDMGILKPLPNLTVINTDGRHYVERTEKKYDVIIIDLPDPDTYQINRFYTTEFFVHAKQKLTSGGVLSFGLGFSPNIISDIRWEKLSLMYRTARTQFRSVLVLPGGEAFFLCSDGKLDDAIPERLQSKSIHTSYIEGFFHGNVTGDRIRELNDGLRQAGPINRDFEPRMMSVLFKEWFVKHGDSPKAFFMVFLGIAVLYLVFLKREEAILFSTGLVTMGVEMLIIFTFQVLYGYIYLKIGAIVTAFLLGLLPGSMIGNLSQEERWGNLVGSELAFTGLLCLFLGWIRFGNVTPQPIYFLGYSFIFSFLCGLQFPAVTRIIGEKKSPAAGCLAADLSGAAVGTLITGSVLIPLWGIETAIIFLILVKISSNMLVLFVKRI